MSAVVRVWLSICRQIKLVSPFLCMLNISWVIALPVWFICFQNLITAYS